MSGGINVKNCRIIIRDTESGKTVADTYITGYDWDTNSVRISTTSLGGNRYGSISALIFGKDGFYEYYGKIEKANVANETVVALYSGQTRKGRASRRYDLHAQGDVTKIKIADAYIELQKPIEFTTLNISATGLLFRTFCDSFSRGDRICLRVLLEGKELELECKVIRVQNSDLWEEEYGCKIVAIRSDMERLVRDNETER